MSSLVNNDPASVKMRRNRGTLSVAGLGVMAFGLWSVVKFVMECLIGKIREDLVNTYSDTGTILAWIVIIVVIHLILTDVILRYIVGRCAWRESRGLRQGCWYLILAGNIAAGSILSIYLEAESIISLRVGATKRLYGYMDRAVFCVLWYDPDHGDNNTCVCRAAKKHT